MNAAKKTGRSGREKQLAQTCGQTRRRRRLRRRRRTEEHDIDWTSLAVKALRFHGQGRRPPPQEQRRGRRFCQQPAPPLALLRPPFGPVGQCLTDSVFSVSTVDWPNWSQNRPLRQRLRSYRVPAALKQLGSAVRVLPLRQGGGRSIRSRNPTLSNEKAVTWRTERRCVVGSVRCGSPGSSELC